MENQQQFIIHKEAFPFLNIALYLNKIKPIRSLTIENTSELDSSPIEIRISSDLPCIDSFSFSTESIPAKKDIKIPVDRITLNRTFLNEISETEKAIIKIELVENEKILLVEALTIDVHPLEYFGGFQVLPELIAAYVTPNHPYVYHIKRKAADILKNKGLKAAFEGYQSNNPERVLQVMSAIFSAIRSEEIIYSSLAPGYEETGQRLRLLNTIQKENFANCIDLSLLFAACLEASDLNPIIIVTYGHAFVGCWLQDDKFSEIINDDKVAITKRLSKGIREMAAIEATSVCKGNNISFSEALNMGEAQLVQKEDFLLSIDIKQARTTRIRPLPLLTNVTSNMLDEEAIKKDEIANMEKRFDIGTIYEDELSQGSLFINKQKIWERKLLDLSLRNNLINLRITKNMLQLVDIDISHLEDTLSEGKTFSIVPSPNVEIQRKYNVFNQTLHHSSELYQFANDEIKYNRLHTYYHKHDLENVLSYISKNAKQSIEENGSSTLYLAVGLLKWFDKKIPEQPRYAPILLVPVELNRRSINTRFALKSREEETLINITLIEFLRQEHELNLSGLTELPYDEKGVDVAKVMGILRRAIMQLKGWDVEEQLVLGNFSFNKLILWKDIVDHEAELLKSDLVKSLVDGKLSFYNNSDTITQADFDNLEAHSLTLPISTDVSQMEAVLTAQKGHSFILHGPPGTGKSQTITNIIADALYRGKRVLFVAAKKAALDVVHRRLEQIGLAPFTLELHSNKSKKSDVLAQLSNSIETFRTNQNSNYLADSQRLDLAKQAISNYVNLLHKKQPFGWSLYDSITALENYPAGSFSNTIVPESVIDQLNESLWLQWNDWLPQFQSIINLIIHPSQNPLAEIKITQYSVSINESIELQTKQLLEILPKVQELSQSLSSSVHFPFSIDSRKEYDQFFQVITTLNDLPNTPIEFCRYLSDKENQNVFVEWCNYFTLYQTSLNNILQNFNRAVLNIDIFSIEIQWKQAQKSWFLPKWLKKRNIRKQLSLYESTSEINDNAIEALFINHNQLKENQLKLQKSRFTDLQSALRSLYKDDQTDVYDIEKKAAGIKQLDSALSLWDYNGLSKWSKLLLNLHINYLDEVRGPNSNLINEYLNTRIKFNELERIYQSTTGIKFSYEENWLNAAALQLRNILTSLPRLKEWMNYVQIKNAGSIIQLQWLIDAYESRKFTNENLNDFYHYTINYSITSHIIGKHESLSMFNLALFENKIAQYKKIAKDFQVLTIYELRAKLSSRLPNTAIEAMQSSEIGILQRAIKNRGRGLSIRKLFDQIPTLLPRTSPCMLMSPISVAQYFNVDNKHFDLVIFDEASQLPTCEAISALARAKQAIIVGDPKQMPPTSFFNSSKIDEENIEFEDLESILDDCLSLSIPSKYLLRHYRSKHESLIAFSNVNYYDSKLLTFPSSDDLNRKVKYHHISGFYDKGKTRTNKFEAEAIVEYIKQHYNDSLKKNKSLGVVTFSQTQQSLIEEKLVQLFIADPQLEQFINEREEPLFIKNLENVQGDERDIILFSIGYAPDEKGKISMNFGPLNRNGGWRRLNVAVTRARYEMHVFATLKVDQIDLSRTSSEGVAGLKAFLNFAEKGHLAIRSEDLISTQNQKHLSEAIGKRLQERGLTIKSNIGTSSYKIDIGIVHPEKPTQYVLGIVLDGYYYLNAHTTNDREMVMPAVLKSLGWNIYRIWTIDWYENSEKIIETVLKLVDELKALKLVENEPEEIPKTTFFDNQIQNESNTENLSLKINNKQKPYIACTLTPVSNSNSEMLYDFFNRSKIKEQIQDVVSVEEPISKSLLFKKVLQAWNTSRAGTKLENYLMGIVREIGLTETYHHQPFFKTKKEGGEIDYYRNNHEEKPSIEDIAPEEIIVALHEVVTNNFSIEEEDLIRYLARTFGFSKVGKQIEIIVRYSIELAVKKGTVKKEDGRIKII